MAASKYRFLYHESGAFRVEEVNEILGDINKPVSCVALDEGPGDGIVVFHIDNYDLSSEEWSAVFNIFNISREHGDDDDLTYTESPEQLRKLIVEFQENQEKEEDIYEGYAAKIAEIFCSDILLDKKIEEASEILNKLVAWEKVSVWGKLDVENSEGWSLEEVRALGALFEIATIQIAVKSVRVEQALDGKLTT